MKNKRNLFLVEVAVFASLAMVFDVVSGMISARIWPQGGSISIAMVPIFILAYRWGVKGGLAVGFLFGLLQLIINPYFLNIAQVFLDYIVAFTVLGFAGLFQKKIQLSFSKKTSNWMMLSIVGVVFASSLRYIAAVLSGVIFFSESAPEGVPVWEYSLLYNLGYLGPSVILCVLLVLFLLKSLPKHLFYPDKESFIKDGTSL